MRKHISFHVSDIYDSYSDFLYSCPSFLEGFSRAIDMGSTLNNYNVSKSDQEADHKAIMSDWITIGNDLKRSILIVYDEHKAMFEDDSR